MDTKQIPEVFLKLKSEGYIKEDDILKTQDGFYLVYKSLADILLEKGVTDFPEEKDFYAATFLMIGFYMPFRISLSTHTAF